MQYTHAWLRQIVTPCACRYTRAVTRIMPFAACAFCVASMFVQAASAQSYPTKPIRIVTAEAGGSSDFCARIIAQWLTSSLRQQVIVDNRGASGGVIAAQIVAR